MKEVKTYLSKLILNPRNSRARQDLAQPYEMHRTLSRGLDNSGPKGRMLFRLEPERGPIGPVVLVQHDETAPDWQPLLVNGYLLGVQGPKDVSMHLQPKQPLRFRLFANPVKRIRVEGKKHPVRIPLTHPTPKDGIDTTYWDWLHRQADAHGFQILNASDIPTRHASNRNGKATYEKHEIPHFGVRFDGILRVLEPDKVVDAVRRGIGPAKAFGFGLLSLAPVR